MLTSRSLLFLLPDLIVTVNLFCLEATKVFRVINRWSPAWWMSLKGIWLTIFLAGSLYKYNLMCLIFSYLHYSTFKVLSFDLFQWMEICWVCDLLPQTTVAQLPHHCWRISNSNNSWCFNKTIHLPIPSNRLIITLTLAMVITGRFPAATSITRTLTENVKCVFWKTGTDLFIFDF